MALGKNIMELRVKKGLSQDGLSELTNGVVSQGTISALEKRDSKSSEFAEVLADALGVPVSELLSGKIGKKSAITQNSDHAINQYHDAHGSMGGGLVLRDQPGHITGWRVTHEWMEKNVPSNTGINNLCIVTGFGDSMRGMFNSGDPLIVDTGVKDCKYDGVYFFRIGDEGFIKRLQRIPGAGIRAISENKSYESWTISADMDFEVFGRVLKVWKSEEF